MHEKEKYKLSEDGGRLLVDCKGGPNNVPVDSRTEEEDALFHTLRVEGGFEQPPAPPTPPDPPSPDEPVPPGQGGPVTQGPTPPLIPAGDGDGTPANIGAGNPNGTEPSRDSAELGPPDMVGNHPPDTPPDTDGGPDGGGVETGPGADGAPPVS